jgi:hypothetical protein
MRAMAFWALTCGCWSNFVDPPTVSPGGKIQASLAGGSVHTTAAVAHGKSEPMVVDGASTELTFSLTAADTLGGTALADLKQAGDTTQLQIYSGSRNKLEIHLEGGGCVAVTGAVNLSLDGNGHLAGAFEADGMVSGGTNSCQMTGTLADVPQDR